MVAGSRSYGLPMPGRLRSTTQEARLPADPVTPGYKSVKRRRAPREKPSPQKHHTTTLVGPPPPPSQKPTFLGLFTRQIPLFSPPGGGHRLPPGNPWVGSGQFWTPPPPRGGAGPA